MVTYLSTDHAERGGSAPSGVVLSWDAFYAGFYSTTGSHVSEMEAMWALARDVGLIIGSLSWIFFQFLSLRSREHKEPLIGS